MPRLLRRADGDGIGRGAAAAGGDSKSRLLTQRGRTPSVFHRFRLYFVPSENGTRTGHVVHPTLKGIWPAREPANVPNFVGPCPVRYAPLSRPRRKPQPQACAASLRIVIASVQYCRLVCKEQIAHTTWHTTCRPAAPGSGMHAGTR
eukprot:5851480-Prymnesium_polylepis.1